MPALYIDVVNMHAAEKYCCVQSAYHTPLVGAADQNDLDLLLIQTERIWVQEILSHFATPIPSHCTLHLHAYVFTIIKYCMKLLLIYNIIIIIAAYNYMAKPSLQVPWCPGQASTPR